MRIFRNFAILLALVAVVSVGTLTIQAYQAAPAHAYPSCYGATCKNWDPTTTVSPNGVLCSHQAYLQEEVDSQTGGGYIQN